MFRSVHWQASQHVTLSHLLIVAFLHQSLERFNARCALLLQRVHQRWLLQLHAPEAHFTGTSKGAVRPPKEKVEESEQ